MSTRDARLPDLHIVVRPEEERQLLTEAIRRHAAEVPRIDILEAGCGKRWPIDVSGLNYHLTGIDTDAEALRLRQERRGDLNKAILGDLTTHQFPPESFDVVYCSYVLEHVRGAENVLDRFLAALRPGGLLILRIPDGDSVYGFLTRHTPYWLHVQFKRWVKGHKMAGKPGYGPYPTVYDPVISRAGLTAYCRSRGLRMRLQYGSNYHVRIFPTPLIPLVDLGLRGIAGLSRGRLSASHNNIGVVIEKP